MAIAAKLASLGCCVCVLLAACRPAEDADIANSHDAGDIEGTKSHADIDATVMPSPAADTNLAGRRPLTSPGAWQAADAQQDPLAEHRPAAFECSALTGFYVEDDVLEIDTGRCSYVTLQQPLAAAVQTGDVVLLDIVHFDLTAPEPAEAHLALLLGGQTLWQDEIVIPSPANRIQVELSITQAHAEQTPVYFHLHNHGQNTWRLMGIWLK